MRVGEEKHQDGGIHFHVMVTFGKKVHTRNVRAFDLYNTANELEHPNISRVQKKHFLNRLCYASKDGKFTDFGK